MVQGDFQRFVNVRVSRNNRPLWVGAIHGEATKPSEASAERAFVSRGLPRTEGWNGAMAFDEGRWEQESKI